MTGTRCVGCRMTLSLIAAALLFVVVLAWLAPFSRFDETYDLRVYRTGAVAVAHGIDPYSEPAHYGGPFFTYPPFAAAVFIPLAPLPLEVDRVVVTALSLVCVVVLALLAVRAERPARLDDQRLWATVLVAAAIGLLLEPVRSTLSFGQVDLMLAVLVVADLVPRRRILPQGVLIGLAAGVKLVPGLFIVYLLLTRRLRAAAWACWTFAATVAVGFVVMPGAATEYWTRFAFDSAHIGRLDYVGNQSLLALVKRLVDDRTVLYVAWLILTLAVLVIGLWIAVRLHGRGRELAAVCAVALTGLLVSPVSWEHHWVWALPVAVLLLIGADTAGRWGWRVVGLLWSLLFCLAPIWWVPDRFDYDARYGGWRLLASNSYVLAGAAMLVAIGVSWSRRAEHPSPPGACRRLRGKE